MRLHLRNNFTVGAKHKPQHAVGAGMLRPHVDEHLIGANVKLDDPRIVVNQLCHRSISFRCKRNL